MEAYRDVRKPANASPTQLRSRWLPQHAVSNATLGWDMASRAGRCWGLCRRRPLELCTSSSGVLDTLTGVVTSVMEDIRESEDHGRQNFLLGKEARVGQRYYKGFTSARIETPP